MRLCAVLTVTDTHVVNAERANGSASIVNDYVLFLLYLTINIRVLIPNPVDPVYSLHKNPPYVYKPTIWACAHTGSNDPLVGLLGKKVN